MRKENSIDNGLTMKNISIKLQNIINKKLKNRGWCLKKSTQPLSYLFLQYGADDSTIEIFLREKTPAKLAKRIIDTYDKQ